MQDTNPRPNGLDNSSSDDAWEPFDDGATGVTVRNRLNHEFVMLPWAVLKAPDVSHTELRLYAVLLMRADWTTANVALPRAELASLAQMSERAVHDARKALERRGWIISRGRKDASGGALAPVISIVGPVDKGVANDARGGGKYRQEGVAPVARNRTDIYNSDRDRASKPVDNSGPTTGPPQTNESIAERNARSMRAALEAAGLDEDGEPLTEKAKNPPQGSDNFYRGVADAHERAAEARALLQRGSPATERKRRDAEPIGAAERLGEENMRRLTPIEGDLTEALEASIEQVHARRRAAMRVVGSDPPAV